MINLNDPIGNWTRDIQASSAVPQSTASPRGPWYVSVICIITGISMRIASGPHQPSFFEGRDHVSGRYSNLIHCSPRAPLHIRPFISLKATFVSQLVHFSLNKLYSLFQATNFPYDDISAFSSPSSRIIGVKSRSASHRTAVLEI
jgi:hypothetical protein